MTNGKRDEGKKEGEVNIVTADWWNPSPIPESVSLSSSEQS